MLMNKIDYAKMGENYLPDHGGIEDAITKTKQPFMLSIATVFISAI